MNDAGRIGFVIRGDYDTEIAYDFLDLVYYNGASYVAKKLTKGNTPQRDNEYWHIFADAYSVDINDETPTFSESGIRANINSGEKMSSILGKIKKWFADMTTAAFMQVITSNTDLMATTVAGYLADALAVKQQFDAVYSNLDKLSFLKTYNLYPSSDGASSDWITYSDGTKITKENASYFIIEAVVTGTSNRAYTRVLVAYSVGITVLDSVESSTGAANTPIIFYDEYGYLKIRSQGILTQRYTYKVKVSTFT